MFGGRTTKRLLKCSAVVGAGSREVRGYPLAPDVTFIRFLIIMQRYIERMMEKFIAGVIVCLGLGLGGCHAAELTATQQQTALEQYEKEQQAFRERYTKRKRGLES